MSVEKNFSDYFKEVIEEVISSASSIYARSCNAATSEVFDNPSLIELKTLMNKYVNYSNHVFQFFKVIRDSEISVEMEKYLDGLIQVAKSESYEDKLNQGRLVYKKLLIITRHILQNAKMVGKSEIALRMQSSLMIATYMAVENYAAAKNMKLMPAKEIFNIKEQLRMAQVIEANLVGYIVSETNAAQNIMKNMNAVLADNAAFSKPLITYQDKLGARKDLELA